jgi:hypothetical protein
MADGTVARKWQAHRRRRPAVCRSRLLEFITSTKAANGWVFRPCSIAGSHVEAVHNGETWLRLEDLED